MKQPWHKKPEFGSLYLTGGSKYIYISINYYKQRLRFPTDREDSPKNWDELRDFLADVGRKIANHTFCFAKAFYWLDQKTKEHFSQLEGNDYKPEAEHVLFGEFAREWMEKKIPTFSSVSKQGFYREALNSRILPYFENKTFACITVSEMETFIDNLKRSDGSDLPLSTKRVKNIIGPMAAVWLSARNNNNWNLTSPFTGLSLKYADIKDKAVQEKEKRAAMLDDDEETVSTRDVLLLSEWQLLLTHVDPHYHPVMELLMMGMIGSELEGLQKRHIKDGHIHVKCAVVREKGGKKHLKFKPKNWFRKRDIPLTANLQTLMEKAATASTSQGTIKFDNKIELPAQAFLLTMKNGKPFNYISFRKSVWKKAFKLAELDYKVPYAARHTLVQWALMVGVNKSRLIDLMGHSTKKMIDEVYGTYRKGLVDERQQILDYLGDDFLSLEELRTAFPERYRQRMALPLEPAIITKTPDSATTFCQSFGQIQGLYADNYSK